MGSSTSKVNKVDAMTAASPCSSSAQSEQEASETDAAAERRDELRLWRGKTRFADLPEAGMKAFEEFLSEGDRRRLQFWLKDSNFDEDVLRSFICDGPDMLKDVTDDVEVKDDILQKAADVAKYVRELRAKMEPDLNSEFGKFQGEIDKQMAKQSR